MRAQVILNALLIGGLAAAGAGTANGEVVIERANVERAADGRVLVRWHSLPSAAPVDLFIDSRLISDDDRDGQHELTAAEAAKRPLIKLVTPEGHSLITAERVLPLQGGRNFRDLGGYRTADGKQVKWGRVFRSGTMAHLTDVDYTFLSSLGIRVICDFRSNHERQDEPTDWRTIGTQPDYRTANYEVERRSRSLFGEGAPTAESVRAGMTRLYTELPYEHAESYRVMFKSLAAGEIPLAFNCAGGKDRAGVGAALLLTLLGVPRDTVIEDYALSEKVVNFEAEYAARQSASASDKNPALGLVPRLPAEVRTPMLRSDPDYLRAALRAIEQREGSIDAYFERVLSITSTERQRIRELLLEPTR